MFEEAHLRSIHEGDWMKFMRIGSKLWSVSVL